MKVDSILPPGQALERFLAGTSRPGELSGGAPNREDLAARFFKAIQERDSAALADMLVTRGEYGALYYPASIYSRKPYELAPDIAWMLNSEASAKGARRLLQRLGGQSLEPGELDCLESSIEGDNRISSDCQATYRVANGNVERRQLFKSMIERDGQVKFLSYAGDF